MAMIEKIMDLLERELTLVMRNDAEYYGNYRILLANEQQFVKDKDREKGAIYIVVKFMPSAMNFGQTVLSVTINAMSEKNDLEVCQKLLLELAQTYNLTKNDDGTILQAFSTPSVMSNFNDVLAGYRSLMYESATFLISENSNPFELSYFNATTNKWEEVPCITSTFECNINLDPQPLFSSLNFTKSVAKMGTMVIGIVTYVLDVPIINQCLDVCIKTKGINTDFKLKIKWKNGKEYTNEHFKMGYYNSQQDIGQLPIATITFTE